MAEAEGEPAPLTAAGLEGLTQFELDKEYARLGTRYRVLGPHSQPLFEIERPAGQAAASEALNIFVSVAASNSKHRRRRPAGSVLGAKVEHSLSRHYEMWALDDRWLGRIEKSGGRERPQWTLYLSDWQALAWVDLTPNAYGPPTAVVLDAAGNPAMSVPVMPSPVPMPMVDPYGRPAGDITMGYQNYNQRILIRSFARIHPIHFVFLAVVLDYETHPAE